MPDAKRPNVKPLARPMIEALEPRLLFSAVADVAVFDDQHSDTHYLAQAAANLDLAQVYLGSPGADTNSHQVDALAEVPPALSLIHI